MILLIPRQVFGEQKNSQEKVKENVLAVVEDTEVVKESGWKEEGRSLCRYCVLKQDPGL